MTKWQLDTFNSAAEYLINSDAAGPAEADRKEIR